VAARIRLLGKHEIAFDEPMNLLFHRDQMLPGHSNGMRFTARNAAGATLLAEEMYSIGGGAVQRSDEETSGAAAAPANIPLPFGSGAELLERADSAGLSIAGLMRRNEEALRPAAEVDSRLARIWSVMQACVERGFAAEGVLPGVLKVKRRAPQMKRALAAEAGRADAMEWVNAWALAVNEENAAGGQVVTAPTNGAAGIVPAVLHYYAKLCPGSDAAGIQQFLLAAGAIGLLYKRNASISGAEMGCQGEVGVACSMAAAGLATAFGGTNTQVENAAEIGMEHNLGLTCDPIAGLVQIPCIERNAMGAVKAINAARLALRGDGTHKVSLDQVIATMRQTGYDMKSIYKETSQGGLPSTSRNAVGDATFPTGDRPFGGGERRLYCAKRSVARTSSSVMPGSKAVPGVADDAKLPGRRVGPSGEHRASTSPALHDGRGCGGSGRCRRQLLSPSEPAVHGVVALDARRRARIHSPHLRTLSSSVSR
jgi:L-serine dehydratase